MVHAQARQMALYALEDSVLMRFVVEMMVVRNTLVAMQIQVFLEHVFPLMLVAVMILMIATILLIQGCVKPIAGIIGDREQKQYLLANTIHRQQQNAVVMMLMNILAMMHQDAVKLPILMLLMGYAEAYAVKHFQEALLQQKLLHVLQQVELFSV
jgi:uncharacterized membrane protein